MNNDISPLIIIGAGPAGGSAALFTAKAGKKTVILDSNTSATKRAWLENHYGVAEISGADLVETGLAQAKKFGAERIETKAGTEPRVKTIFAVDAAGKTNVEGIWAAGTCAGVSVHTIITAGDGAKVAINLISELNGERYVDHDVLKK